MSNVLRPVNRAIFASIEQKTTRLFYLPIHTPFWHG